MRKTWSKKEIKLFISDYSYAQDFFPKKSLVVLEDDKLFVDNKLFFRRVDNRFVPSLELLQVHKDILPKVVVDKGTPPFIAKGADLMRPGVVSCDSFEKGSDVVIVDETHLFPIACGVSLFSSDDLLSLDSGKVVRLLFNLKSE